VNSLYRTTVNLSSHAKRPYASKQREAAAATTRKNLLHAAKTLFARRGIDAITIADIAAKADVSPSTIYTLFKSKEGILRALVEETLFGDRYRVASERLDGIADPVEQLVLTATIARAIYESEEAELGLIRGASAFSPELRKLEQTFEEARFSLQRERVERLYAQGRAKQDLPLEKARRLLWMYTGRDVYRLLVKEGGWSPDDYERWLARTLVDALVAT